MTGPERGEVIQFERAVMGHNGFIEPRNWAWEVAQSEAHAFIKLIIHTLELLVKEGQQAAHVSDERLAQLTSLSVKTIKKYRRDAMDEGWFSFSLGNGRGMVTEYRISVPQRTIQEIAARLDAVAKGYPSRDTFSERGTQKTTPASTPFTERLPCEGDLSGQKGTPAGVPYKEATEKKVPPHPPEKNNIYIPPVPLPAAEPPAEPRKLARQMTLGWRPDPRTIAWAKGDKIGATDRQIDEQFEAFCDFHQSKGNRFLNWDQAFQTWMRNAKKRGEINGSYYRPANGSHFKERSLLSDDEPPRKLRPRCEGET